MSQRQLSEQALRNRAITVSAALSVVVLAGKMVAFWITHSTALFADAAESVVHVVVTSFSAFCVWFAARPADVTHPYGHGRIVYFSVGFEGALVTATSICVFAIGLAALVRGQSIHAPTVGLAIGGVVAILNASLAVWLGCCARRARSSVLAANATHIWSDVGTSGAALAGLSLAYLTGRSWCDAAAALAVSGLILLSGFRLLRRAVGGLMDRVEPEELGLAKACLEEAVRRGEISGFHQLKGRVLDDRLWLDMHLQVPADLSIYEAHRRATVVEGRLRRGFPGRDVYVTTHIEPEGHVAAHPVGYTEVVDPFADNDSATPI